LQCCDAMAQCFAKSANCEWVVLDLLLGGCSDEACVAGFYGG
jgi:hypothetical protein